MCRTNKSNPWTSQLTELVGSAANVSDTTAHLNWSGVHVWIHQSCFGSTRGADTLLSRWFLCSRWSVYTHWVDHLGEALILTWIVTVVKEITASCTPDTPPISILVRHLAVKLLYFYRDIGIPYEKLYMLNRMCVCGTINREDKLS